MEIDSSNDDIFEVIERFVVLEIYMKAIFNAYFHFHWDHFVCLFNLLVGQQNRKIGLFYHWKFPTDHYSDEISHSTRNSTEGLVFFLEIGEFKFERFVLGKYTCGLEFFTERGELCAEIFVGVYF